MTARHCSSGWVLVTGGSRGIGRAIVLSLARAGYDSVFTYKSAEAEAHSVIRQLHDEGRACRTVRCDGSVESHVVDVTRDLLAELGAPYALINNLGISRDELLVGMKAGTAREVLSTNVESAIHFSHAVLGAMMERRDGVILQMGSISGLRGRAGQTAYAASKAALIGFSRALALEVGRFNIRVNTVVPGLIETDMIRQLPADQLTQLKRAIPLRRVGRVTDVASVVEFLLSSGAEYITGQTLVVDGGLSC